MKRLLSLALATAMLLSMVVVSNAATLDVGDIVIKESDNSNFDTILNRDAIPGETIYIYVADADDYPSGTKAPTNAKNSLECHSNSDDKPSKIISSSSLKVEKRRIAANTYAYFATLSINSVSPSNYLAADGYYVDGYITYNGIEIDVAFEIRYSEEDASGAYFYKELTIYKAPEVNDDVLIYFDDGEFVGVSPGKGSAFASLSTAYNNTIGNKYSSADLDFYDFGGANLKDIVKSNSYLKIEASSGMYLYELKGSTLTDLSDTYDRNERGFIVKTNVLGSYVLSDMALSGSVSSSSSSSTPPSSSQPPIITNPIAPINPPTGAAA